MGSRAVFVGHFFGPLRAIVFIGAGIVDMRPLRFQIVNVPGAMAWAYAIPKSGEIGGDVLGALGGRVRRLNAGKHPRSRLAELRRSRRWPISAADFVGIKIPNPFWLASAPPTDKAYKVRRAFDAGWGGAVWKTLGPTRIVNVNGPRYGAI